MESQDHKITTPSGPENHGPHLCHKCGWPFPNPHPSARHRRAHKKVCGKIEGYKLSESEAGNSTHSAVSDDEHHSDGDQQTPSPIGRKTSVKDGSSGDKSYRSEDETFSDAVTEFSDSGISPGMEEPLEGVKSMNINVKKVDDELMKADSIGGISVSVTDNRHTAEINDPESLESATNQPVADKSLGSKLDRPVNVQSDASPVKSEIPVDASLQEIKETESIEAKQVQVSSGQPNDLKGIEAINAGEGLVDAVEASFEVSQSVVSDTDEKTSNNESYESKPQEAEGKRSDPLSLSSDLLGANRKFSVVESKLLEAEEQATDSVPNEAELQHNEKENPNSADLKLAFSEAEVKSLDGVDAYKEHEQLDKAEQDKQRISTELSPYAAPILESKAVSPNEIDGGRQMELSDSSKAEERREDVHVVSLAKDLPALDNPELLKDFKDYNKFKSSFPLDLGSSEEIFSAKDDAVAASEVSQSFVDTGRSDGSISSVALDVSRDQVSEEKVAVSAEGKTDSSGLASNPNTLQCGVSSIPNSNSLQEPEDSSKNSLSSYQEEAKQSTKVDDPVIERTEETSFTMAEDNKGGHPENELLAKNETAPVATSCLSEAIQTAVTLGGSDHDEHEKVRTECPIVAGAETEKEMTKEKLPGVSEGDKTICPVGGHNDHAIVTDTTVHESREEICHEASEDSSINKDSKALDSASATGLDSKVISDCDVKEPTGLNSRVVDTDLYSRVVDNSHAGDVLKSATGVISSASQNEGDDKLIKQHDTVSAVDTPLTSSSRTDSLDANWGSISVLSTQSESTAVPDAERTDTRGLEKSEHDLQKPTSGAEECHPDMTLVESGESSANKKATASEIEIQLNAQRTKTEALKAGWFPSITNVVNESQGRKKNEEIIAKVTNWSTGKQQHTPLKSLLGEARSPNLKQVPPSVNKKDETASTKTPTVNSILSSDAPTAVSKEAEKEWNSPARYPVDIKKEKRKTKPYWVPFVCCSSVHQDA
ncbi:uncharacterized protein LOC129883323 [Solanum dulcamara]|uniref:uncharacterized protein LOC129883323 n=1 Tax=Solanum dulcamara TaxID=45834 RepID=UPI0024852C13|nr:uncharacterized protein LOC129883323 [Solanum dulcamara]